MSSLFYVFYFACMGACVPHVCLVPVEARRGCQTSRTGSDSGELLHGCWELKLLEEQPVLKPWSRLSSPHCRCNVTSCLKLLPMAPIRMICTLNWEEINLSPLCCFCQLFCYDNEITHIKEMGVFINRLVACGQLYMKMCQKLKRK